MNGNLWLASSPQWQHHLISNMAFATNITYSKTNCNLEQWCSPWESCRILSIQLQISQRGECARYGDSSRVVSRAIDGSRFPGQLVFNCYATSRSHGHILANTCPPSIIHLTHNKNSLMATTAFLRLLGWKTYTYNWEFGVARKWIIRPSTIAMNTCEYLCCVSPCTPFEHIRFSLLHPGFNVYRWW